STARHGFHTARLIGIASRGGGASLGWWSLVTSHCARLRLRGSGAARDRTTSTAGNGCALAPRLDDRQQVVAELSERLDVAGLAEGLTPARPGRLRDNN